MAKKKKNGFDASVLEKYAERLEEAGGHAAIERATQAAMITAKMEVNKDIRSAVQPGNLPAGGKYSHGDTAKSIDTTTAVEWEGNIASLHLGFDMDKSGLTSIFLMYGTPKMQPAQGLREAVYGENTRRRVRKAMEEAIEKVLERLGG
uniref:Uncharacterized protein n=1 Tax=Siphoviridae sp. ctkyH28 TaxID=2827585 RepID=A0A8S5LM78_9CAUD|nr:MAG TPA: hypothetical protein [Siphoviridae sp. ctkyH28]